MSVDLDTTNIFGTGDSEEESSYVLRDGEQGRIPCLNFLEFKKKEKIIKKPKVFNDHDEGIFRT